MINYCSAIRREFLMLSPVYSSYQFCLSAQFRKSPEAFPFENHRCSRIPRDRSFRDTHSQNQCAAKPEIVFAYRFDCIAEQTTIATNHSCETFAAASITKTRRQTNALNLLAIPIVNPRVSRVMKHRHCCTRLRAAAQCFQR